MPFQNLAIKDYLLLIVFKQSINKLACDTKGFFFSSFCVSVFYETVLKIPNGA